MRLLIRIISILGILLALSIGILIAPYFAYNYVVKQGMDNEYIKLSPHPAKLYGEKNFKMERVEGIYHEDESLWGIFPFSNVQISLPLKHPQIRVLPHLNLPKGTAEKLEMGLTYTDQNYHKLVTMILKRHGKFQFPFISDHKLFSLPLFKKYILGKSNKQIWKDLFTRDLTTTFILRKHFKSRNLVDYLTDLYSVSYRDLVYSLFIYYLRIELLNEDFEESRYFEGRGMGVIYIPPKSEKSFQKEIVFILEKGEIYTVEIVSKIKSIMAESLRIRLLEHLKYVEDSDSNAHEIYALYKRVDYEERISNLGMMYLYTAWSHVPENTKFLKELIHFLERGKDNSIPLEILYRYAYEKYGSNFSQLIEKRNETFDEKMKRLHSEALDKEIEEERQKKVRYDADNFESDNARRDYYLQKAKDQDKSEDFKEVKIEEDYLTD
ncbi:MAG: hypothetical protein KAG61_08725 [Bacteriovoracaceae bacterium]|nr:hypothetical protein [Bacteriovoracaceae bacterium]